MAFAKLRVTASQQLVLQASGEAMAFIAAKGPHGAAPTAVRFKKPEEVEKEAKARVVSKGGDPGNPMLVLSHHSIQFGKYQGQTFRWLLENDVGYTSQLVASHQRERERSASDSSLMANKDALARYLCSYATFADLVKFRRLHEEARARAAQPGCEGEALVGFGLYKEATLKDLYDSKEKEHQGFVKWLRRKTPQPGTAMDAARKYILGRDKERSAEAAAAAPSRNSSSSSSSSTTTTTSSSGVPSSSSTSTTSKAAASTVLPPRKPIAPAVSALLGRRPMAPGELQAKVRKLMTPTARPAVPAVSKAVRDQHPSVPPPPPTTEVTDEELVQMAIEVETVEAGA